MSSHINQVFMRVDDWPKLICQVNKAVTLHDHHPDMLDTEKGLFMQVVNSYNAL